MKANFALSLSSDGIRLLHRAAGGWTFVGDVSLEDPEFPNALNALREMAMQREPSDIRTKLVIPETQIKYLTIDTPGASIEERRQAAKQALNGSTPYAVEDLAFDVSEDGDQTHIAAVAKETLIEAEDFAASYQFNPISTVAIPGDADFLGEPFFGQTRFARDTFTENETVEPDFVAIVEIDLPDTALKNIADVSIISSGQIDDQPSDITSEKDRPAKPTESIDAAWVPEAPDADLSSEPFDDGAYPEEEPTDPAETAENDVAQVIGFASRRKSPGGDTDVSSTDSLPGTSRINVDVIADGEEETFFDPAPNETNAQPSAGFATRRDTDITVPSRLQSAASGSLYATRSQRPTASSAPFAPTTSEQQRLTVFGARKPDPQVRPRAGGSRAVGLMLTAVLLVALAGVAAWAAVFREDGLASFFSAPDVVDALASIEELAPEPELSPVIESVQTASLEISPPEPIDPVLAEPDGGVFDPKAAEAHYALTGIWAIPPNVPQAPSLLGLDDLYITSIDRSNLSFDAVALAPPTSFDTDVSIRTPSNPAPSGTQFALDDRGLVVATAQGALSPDGFTVFLGRPVAVPPTTPDRSIASAPNDVPDARAELAAFRPKARPEGLIENNEREQLGGLSRAELASIRPQQRPVLEKQEAEEDETPTAQAAAESKRPTTRPRNFARLVDRARTAQKRAEPAEELPRQVAAVAPRTITPSIPSSASAAKQATVKRAINLNRINLMGVYGTPSDRRALVRLSNGRYKKVRVGDRIDGGKVLAISEGELRYNKGARNIVLKMPKS